MLEGAGVGDTKARERREERGFPAKLCTRSRRLPSEVWTVLQGRAGISLNPSRAPSALPNPPPPKIPTKGLLGKIKCREKTGARLVYSGSQDAAVRPQAGKEGEPRLGS